MDYRPLRSIEVIGYICSFIEEIFFPSILMTNLFDM